MAKVFINPGHCLGVDNGAINKKFRVFEAAVARQIGEKVEKYLQEAGCEVEVLQSNNLCGEAPDTPNVTQNANDCGADIFISLHCNAFNQQAQGTECLIFAKGSYAEDLADAIQAQIVNSLDTVDRGIKERPDLAVLKHTAMPAVLVEMAFIDNAEDCRKLIYQQDEFARAIARGVTDYLSQ